VWSVKNGRPNWNLFSTVAVSSLQPLEFAGISETSIFMVPGENTFGILHSMLPSASFPSRKPTFSLLVVPFASTEVYLWTAYQLEGPWVNRGSIYSIPAPFNNTQAIFCYAPKVHPQFAPDRQSFVFTYMSNTFEVDDLTKYPEVYIAQAVRVSIVQ